MNLLLILERSHGFSDGYGMVFFHLSVQSLRHNGLAGDHLFIETLTLGCLLAPEHESQSVLDNRDIPGFGCDVDSLQPMFLVEPLSFHVSNVSFTMPLGLLSSERSQLEDLKSNAQTVTYIHISHLQIQALLFFCAWNTVKDQPLWMAHKWCKSITWQTCWTVFWVSILAHF